MGQEIIAAVNEDHRGRQLILEMLPTVKNQLILVDTIPPYARLLNYEQALFRIPIAFSSRDHCSLMEVTEGGHRLAYIGASNGEYDAATARSDCEIPPQCGIFYFEVTVLDKGRDGFLSVGLITKASLLKKLVGWETGTIGYHGDDGCLYLGSGKGHAFGPTYGAGDTIGCGVNFSRKQVFFTRNGTYLGDRTYPLSTSPDPLYAAFGMKSPGEAATANFGFNPFTFNIELYILAQQQEYTAVRIAQIDHKLVEPPLVELLVLKHLVHTGCESSALAFFRAAFAGLRAPFSEEELRSMLERSQLRRKFVNLVLAGNVEECIDTLASAYPALLLQHAELDFLLHARLFIESVKDLDPADKEGFERLLSVGQVLEEKLQFVPGPNHRECTALARDALALIAYKDLAACPSAYLTGDSHRQSVAAALEEALLREDCQSPFSNLERLLRAYQADIELLRHLGNESTALITPLDSILRSQSVKPE